jgi:hypothetical protein
MEISDSASPVSLDGNASKREARAKVDAMLNNSLPDARRAAVLRYYLRRAGLAFLPPTHAQARPWPAYAGTRAWPIVIGCVFERAAARIPAGRCKGKTARKDGSGCHAVLTGSRAAYYWESRNAGRTSGTVVVSVLGAIGRGSLTREIGWARMERTDGASRGEKKSWSLFPVYVVRGNERAAEPGVMHCQGPVGIASPQTRRCLRFRLAARASSRCESGTWHFLALTPQLLR